MKKMSRISCTLALLLMSLGAAQTANAIGLAGFSPNDATFTNVAAVGALDPPGLVTIKGLPAWFQGQDGVAVKPCLDIAKCVLVGAPDFNSALPMTYPSNFPSEAFYFNATNANFPVGTAGASAIVVMALEYTFLSPLGALVPPSATTVGNPFQRLRLVHTFPGGGGTITPTPLPGTSWTVITPWGTTVFPLASGKCVNSGGDTKCSMTRDQPAGGPNPTAALGGAIGPPPDSGINTFLRDPAAPVGFLGTGAAVIPYLGAPAGHPNSITVTDPLGQTGTTLALTTLIGQTIGMDVQPGVDHNFGAVLMTPPPVPPVVPFVPVPKTITITNTTGFPVVFVADLNVPAVKTGVDAADFIIGPPTQPVPAPLVPLANCAGTTLTASNVALGTVAGVCGFDITFTPVVAAKAARVANILLAPTAVPVLAANNPPPVTLNLSGTAQVTVTTAVATHGTITPDATVVPIAGSLVDFAAPAGSPVTFTVTPSSKKFKVKSVDDVVAAFAPVPVPAPFTLNTGSTNHAVSATFMQSGDLNVDGKVDVADALVALKIVAGIPQVPDPLDPSNSAVKVAPLDATGQPAALDAKVNPDIGDVLVILRRALNLDAW